MSRFILLDAGPLGLATNPRPNRDFMVWLDRTAVESTLVVPEVSDYEVRRELIRADKELGLVRLDRLGWVCRYLALSTEIMRDAARLWAEVRRRGRPTAGADAPDADVILAASALRLAHPPHQVLVATDNTRHLSLFVDARHWSDIDLP